MAGGSPGVKRTRYMHLPSYIKCNINCHLSILNYELALIDVGGSGVDGMFFPASLLVSVSESSQVGSVRVIPFETWQGVD